ncbi:multidrug resistance protein 3 [Apiospora kogelbergensis]|uniref:Multidrug resistance protein 3 n=1 Tax=Apiospora kogelbergensis TaxID=1337665 RepID=A0AAW0QHT8_9PEZI
MEPDSSVKGILDRQVHGLAPDPSDKKSLYSYSTPRDKIILLLSFICAILGGVLNPLISVIYGQTVGVFGDHSTSTTPTEEARRELVQYTFYWIYLAVAIFVLIYIATVGFYYVGERIARALRNAYLKSIIRQNMAFFDTHEPGEVAKRIMSDMTHVQEGITSKLPIAVTAMATFCSAFIVAIVVNWKTALVLSPTYVLMALFGSLSGARVVKYHKQEKVASEKASSLAQEAISSVRQVYALGIQHALAKRYDAFLIEASRPHRRALYVLGLFTAWCQFLPPTIHALTFWAGSQFLLQGTASVAQITTIAVVAVIGAFAIVRIAPAAQALAATVSSASVIFKEMSRRSPQDPFDPSGAVIEDVAGNIELRGVSLVYPKRPDARVLNNVSFSCPAMKTTAIVGTSGSGKSSIINLLERFYEPTGGEICMDGVDIQSLNLRWLRGQIGLVRQQPVLFDTTIHENIRYGAAAHASDGPQASGDALEEQIIAAAKMANAHEFIMALPDGYQTRRIAIARALMRDPKILLLDEATSALDATSESVVQGALEKAAKHRTTIVIAHRLSTIRNADNIVVMSHGSVVEQGTHGDLIALDGHYARLVSAQQIGSRIQGDQAENEDEYGDDLLNHAIVPADVVDENTPLLGSHSRHATSHEHEVPPTTAEKAKSWGLGKTLALIIRMNSGERWYLVFGLLCSIFAGLCLPAQSIIFAKSLEALSLPPSEYDTLRSRVNLLAGIFCALAIGTAIFYTGLGMAFAYSTERLARVVRDACFRAIVAQDVEFFDEAAVSTGSLLSVLTTSTDALTGLSGPILGGVLSFLSIIAGGVVLSLALSWKLALVCTAAMPLVVACGWVRLQMLAVFDAQTRRSGVAAASFAAEVVRAAGTVAGLGLEDVVLARYDGFLDKQAERSLGSILRASGLYAASSSVVYLASALAFWYGGTLLLDGEYSLFQVYICYTALISGAQIAGSIFAFAPDASKAIAASQEIDDILQRRPGGGHVLAACHSGDGKQKAYSAGGGRARNVHIQFRDVTFAYPSRKTRPALQNFSLDVGVGQFVALVGPSGCGKSTALSLIERFYRPDAGSILVDGQDLASLDLAEHRRTVSLVSQDAMLFSASIRENIALGLAGDADAAPDDAAIWAACRQAHVADFVASLPEGLATRVGPGGGMLSGGQRQRVAIARALLRDPAILLLDEATSALDAASERIVQAALDALAAGRRRTTVAVAHRLSTVRGADLICVLDRGRIVEAGSHEELVRARGRYWGLLEMQDLQ